ncbi:hypothetical protein BSNK01_03460 [Bacillaceae bacterium]
MIKWSRMLAFVLVVAALFALIAATLRGVLNDITLGLDLQGGFEVLYEVKPLEEGKTVTRETLLDAVQAIERRINVLGVSEPEVTIEGSNRIRVQLAGVTDQDEARRILGEPAKLTFRSPDGKILLTGDELKEGGARADFDQYNRPVVALEFKDPEKFARITREYLQQPIGIYLDENLLTNPVVQQVITNGQAQIDGMESVEEAKELAALLNAGALPVEMKEIYSNSVGAKLGEMALEKGVFAGYIATALILLFMLFYYRAPGLIANIMLIAYIYLLLVVFKWMQATLTLPGIAAFILGIGMAVDANIITYERIREELRSGKTIRAAVKAGSRRSLATILDANITTIIAAAVLLYFGTSAIQGFAVTLIVSIVASMITAVFGTRWLLSLLVQSNAVNKLWFFGVKEGEVREL